MRGSTLKIVSMTVCFDNSCNCGALGDTGRLPLDGNVVCANAGARNNSGAYAASRMLEAVMIPILV